MGGESWWWYALAVTLAIGVVTSLLVFGRRIDAATRAFAVIASATGLVALSGVIMRFTYHATDAEVFHQIDNVLVLFVPAVFWVALRALSGHRGRSLLAPVSIALVVWFVVLLVPDTLEWPALMLALAAMFAGAGFEAHSAQVRARPGALAIRVGCALFALYNFGRGITALAFGTETPVWAVVFSDSPSQVSGVLMVVALAWGTTRITRSSAVPTCRDAAMAPRSIARGDVEVSIADFELLRRAVGAARTEDLNQALIEACRSTGPIVVVRKGAVELSLAGDSMAGVAQRVRARYAAATGVSEFGDLGELRFSEPDADPEPQRGLNTLRRSPLSSRRAA